MNLEAEYFPQLARIAVMTSRLIDCRERIYVKDWAHKRCLRQEIVWW
jgi:hypothetical protein